jgi:adenosylmethionine---8-amino-7-oxononanoate aminotransferase
MNPNILITKDLQHVWHPCSQMKDFESSPPLIVKSAAGCYINTDHGPLIDGISSWWCKSLGHGHPAVRRAIQHQLNQFEHVIGANTTYPELVELAQLLAEITGKQHVFFASDGSSAVEIALKLALHANQLKGHPERNQFVALKNGYHGETFAAMSVSDLGIYKAPYEGYGVKCHTIEHIPYLYGKNCTLWSHCDAFWEATRQQLEPIKEQICAIILEPLIQGAGGMLCYSPAFLKSIATWAKANDIYLIADEIMTGIGRTGKWLACHHAGVFPDLICLSKGLTSGSLPLSCIMIDASIYDLFYADHDSGASFLHSHTYSCNPLAICAALATLKTIQQEQILPHVNCIEPLLFNHMAEIATLTGKLHNVRGLGAVVAADLVDITTTRIGHKVSQAALRHGALLRPIGNTLYWLPPLNINEEIIGKLAEITLHSIIDSY